MIPIEKAKVGDVIKLTKESQDCYIVEKTALTGGGTGHGPHDVYPNGWFVTARLLSPGMVYNPAQEVISFFQTGCFTNMIPIVYKIGTMDLTFVNFRSN